jgi:hypothetical protein
VHLYGYVPHCKVLKLFIYVQYGCENQSKVVYSLESASTGSVPNGNRSVTSSVTSTHKNVNFGGTAGKESGHFFQPIFTGIILRAIRVNLATQNWSRGNLKKWHFLLWTP